MIKEIKGALAVFVLLTLITGVAYPAIVTLIAQGVFSHQANGSLMYRGGKAVGSELLGQSFSATRYFWGRPSATTPQPDNGSASAGSNLAVTNPKLDDAVQARLSALHAADPASVAPVPVDLVTASGSGLDPHISPAAAEYQVARVARARGMSETAVRSLVAKATDGRTFGILGEPRVNVLELNLSLDAQTH